jgi:hypothetical protein
VGRDVYCDGSCKLYTAVLTGSYRPFPDGGKTTPVGKETTCPRHSGRFQVRKMAGKRRGNGGKTAGKRWENGGKTVGMERENSGKTAGKPRENGDEEKRYSMKIRGDELWFFNKDDGDHFRRTLTVAIKTASISNFAK